MDPLILEILKNKVPITLEYQCVDGLDKIVYILNGFYRSGTLMLYQTIDGDWKAKDRYGRIESINYFSDIVSTNYFWWLEAIQRWGEDTSPDSLWKEHLISHNYIEEKKVTKTHYVIKK